MRELRGDHRTRAERGGPGRALRERQLRRREGDGEYVPGVASRAEIVAAIENAGYGVVETAEGDLRDAEQEAREAEIRRQTRKFVVGAAFALPLFVLSMARGFALLGAWSHEAWVYWPIFALALPVQFYVGWDFCVGGWKSFRNGSANMDVLVAMGSSASPARARPAPHKEQDDCS